MLANEDTPDSKTCPTNGQKMNQRKIKFRVWDKKQEKMFYCSGRYFLALSEEVWVLIEGSGEKEKIPTNQFEGAVLMQFTGLHDKNGKEIWEGDVIHDSSLAEYEGEYSIYMEDKYNNCVVFWRNEDGGWRVKNKLGSCPLEILTRGNTEAKIIGNIYENPELVESS